MFGRMSMESSLLCVGWSSDVSCLRQYFVRIVGHACTKQFVGIVGHVCTKKFVGIVGHVCTENVL